jgi:Putative peptidoglycan binding domain
MANRPTIAEGDVGPDVKDLIELLPTYYFDATLTRAVEDYQRSRGLTVDGIVGPQTWAALESQAPPYVPPGLPAPMPQAMIDYIAAGAAKSSIASYNWANRGTAPIGYTKGVAVAFGNIYRQWRAGYPPALDMAKANTHNSDKDALSWYAGIFDQYDMDNSKSGAATLRHLWVLLMGLGMRESSGKHCCGRDQSASNISSDTCEAGAWQTSYDAHGCSPQWNILFDAYFASAENPDTDNPQGFLATFKEGVSCSSADWQCYGSGKGYLHQEMSKEAPAYAASVCAITLRNLRQHFGPINRREAEVKQAADDMLWEVQRTIDAAEPVA